MSGYYNDNTVMNHEVDRYFRKPIKEVLERFYDLYGPVAYEPEDPKVRALRDAIERLDRNAKDH